LPKEITVIGGVAGLVGLAALLHVVHSGPTLTFICCALALAGVAHVIGEATDQLGNHLGPAATGIVQSAVGNLPNSSSASSRCKLASSLQCRHL
jgi:Ca2+:H+ antiporter